MKQHHKISRRSFIRSSAIGGIAAMSWPARWSWAVEPSTAADPLRLVFFTDIHARTEWDTPEAMMTAARAINQHQADVVICGGDMITDGYQSSVETVAPRWEAYRAMHDAIQPSPRFVLGNHDLVAVEPDDGTPPAEDPRADAKARMGMTETYGSFDAGGYHFILLDSMQVTTDEYKYRGYIDEVQMDWLRRDLENVAKSTPIILVSHMPLLTSFFQMTRGTEAPVPPNRGVVNNLVVLAQFEHHKLLLVLQGHLHVNEMMRWRETTFITGGAVSGKWWRGEWHGTSEGYGVLNLHPDRVDWEYHTYGWTARRPANA